MKNDSRPINLGFSDLLHFRWPIVALASITHRITGILLFIGIGFGLYGLDMSLSSEAEFRALASILGALPGKIILWLLMSALAYHFVAGIKHLLLDLGIGETLEGGRRAAMVSIFFSLTLIVLAGLWVF